MSRRRWECPGEHLITPESRNGRPFCYACYVVGPSQRVNGRRYNAYARLACPLCHGTGGVGAVEGVDLPSGALNSSSITEGM